LSDSLDTSQVGLFSAQISEQLVRLRALQAEDDRPASTPQNSMRRAVMATRLLSGSSRILHFDEMQSFLDGLLQWLQALEKAGGPLRTTETLLLESVIDLEENLMRHLDRDDAGGLQGFAAEIEDLRQMLARSLENLPESSAVEAPRPQPQALAGPGEPSESPSPLPSRDATKYLGGDAEEATEMLEAAVARLREVMRRETAAATFEVLRTDLAESLSTLREIEEELEQRSQAQRAPATPRDPQLGPTVRNPEEDPIYAPSLAMLQEAADQAGVPLVFRPHGGARALDPSVHELVRSVLEALLADVADEIAGSNCQRPVAVTVGLRSEQGRLLGIVRDDVSDQTLSPAQFDADHVAMLPGLRRARALLMRNDGLLEAGSQARYRFTLPLSTEHRRYAVLTRGDERFAIAASLVDDILAEAAVDVDEDGRETLTLPQRNLPLVDLSEAAPEASYQSEPGEHVVIFGSVEKRLGVRCDGSVEIHAAPDLGEVLPGWEDIAHASLDLDGESVPVLDVRALLRQRFQIHPSPRVRHRPSADESIDSFVPVPSRPRRRTLRALLVNQSEFRRRELMRTLQHQGLSAQATHSLAAAREILASDRIDVLISDLRLGDEGQVSFARLREENPELKIVLTTSVAESYADEVASKSQAHACWRDPFRGSDLASLLAELCDPEDAPK
jgi:chemotaxis protein histidine kinase CheA